MHQAIEKQVHRRKSLNNVIASLKKTKTTFETSMDTDDTASSSPPESIPTPPPEALRSSEPQFLLQSLHQLSTPNETEEEELADESEVDEFEDIISDAEVKSDGKLSFSGESNHSELSINSQWPYSSTNSKLHAALLSKCPTPLTSTINSAFKSFTTFPTCKIDSISPTPPSTVGFSGTIQPSTFGRGQKRTSKTNVYQGLYPIAGVKQYFKKETINNETRYTCLWDNCDFSTRKYSQHISRHIHLKHIGIKELKCNEKECNKVFKRPESLVQHQKNHICGFGIDNERVRDPTNKCGAKNINRHFKRIRDNDIYIYRCHFNDCEFATSNSGSIRRHVHNQHVCPNSASANVFAEVFDGDEEDEEGETLTSESLMQFLQQTVDSQHYLEVQFFESNKPYDPGSRAVDLTFDQPRLVEEEDVRSVPDDETQQDDVGLTQSLVNNLGLDHDSQMAFKNTSQPRSSSPTGTQSTNNRSNGMYSLKNYKDEYRKDRNEVGTVFVCLKCESEGNAGDYKFKSQIALIRHLWEENGFKDFECEICHVKFENEFSLYKHRKTEHSNALPLTSKMSPKEVECPNLQSSPVHSIVNQMNQSIQSTSNISSSHDSHTLANLDQRSHFMEQLQQYQIQQQQNQQLCQLIQIFQIQGLNELEIMNQLTGLAEQQANANVASHLTQQFLASGRASPAESSSSSASLSNRLLSGPSIANLSPVRESDPVVQSDLQRLLTTPNSIDRTDFDNEFQSILNQDHVFQQLHQHQLLQQQQQSLSEQFRIKPNPGVSPNPRKPNSTNLNQYQKFFIRLPTPDGDNYLCKICPNYRVTTSLSMSKHLRSRHSEAIEGTVDLPTTIQIPTLPLAQSLNRSSFTSDPFQGQETEAEHAKQNDEDEEEDGSIDVENFSEEKIKPKTENSDLSFESKPKRRSGHGIYSLKAYQDDYRREKVPPSLIEGLARGNPNGGNQCHYRCTNCDQFTTTSQASMIRHIWQHKDKKSFICRQCGEHFDKEFSLYKHKKNNHPEVTNQNRIRASGGPSRASPSRPKQSSTDVNSSNPPPSLPQMNNLAFSMGHFPNRYPSNSFSFPILPQIPSMSNNNNQSLQNIKSVLLPHLQMSEEVNRSMTSIEEKEASGDEKQHSNRVASPPAVSRRNLHFKRKRTPAHFIKEKLRLPWEEDEDED